MTRFSLAAGAVAGPLFLAVWAIQAFTRDGFRPTFHPLSLLALGDLGWVQIANFVVTGLLYIAFAIGMRRLLHPGRAGLWGTILIALIGLGLVIAGVFTTDAGAGFPAGAPEGAPVVSWHGALHEVGFVLTQVAWIAVCVVLARRFAADGKRGWLVASIVAPVASVVVSAVPDAESFALRAVISTAIQFGYLTAIALYLRRLESGEDEPGTVSAERAGKLAA